MKRDVDLYRAILLEVEKFPFDGKFHEVNVPGYSKDWISYHVLLLHEAGFIRAIDVSDLESIDWRPLRLTHAGHEFLDTGRNSRAWASAKEILLKTAETITVESLATVLRQQIRALVAGA